MKVKGYALLSFFNMIILKDIEGNRLVRYKMYNIHKIKSIIESPNFVKFCRLNMNYFIKNRKINPKDIIYYQLNKKGLSTKMEICYKHT